MVAARYNRQLKQYRDKLVAAEKPKVVQSLPWPAS
jgi:hypothetical protein